MAKFITGKELTSEVYDIIFNAKKQLLLVSPYIKLDDYFKQEVFKEHHKNADLHILIAFGKNEEDPKKSLKREDFEFFMEFPNVTIVYIPNLHAKYYGNEKKGLITSINLYDYSFKNNVEFGVLSENSIFGNNSIDHEAWDTSLDIIEDNYCVFVKRPNFRKKILMGKDYLGSEIILDLTENLLEGKKIKKKRYSKYPEQTFIDEKEITSRKSRKEFEKEQLIKHDIKDKIVEEENIKYYSATALGNLKQKKYNEVIEIMKSHKYIFDKDTITDKGKKKRLKYESNSNGDKWIVYPESLTKKL